MIGAIVSAVAAVAAVAPLGGVAPPPLVGLTVSPAHLSLEAGATASVRVGATSGSRLVLDASLAGLELDARGRPQVGARPDAAAWLQVIPRRVVVGAPGASLVIRSRRPAHVRPGDHTAIVLLSATTPGRSGVRVGVRVGLAVTVVVKGQVTRRVAVVGAHARRARGGGSLVMVTVANRGDVIEAIGGPRFQIMLVRRGHVLARPRVARRKLLPRSRAVLTFHCRLRGPVVARFVARAPGRRLVAVRTFRLRL